MEYDLSLAIPFYNEEQCVKKVVNELVDVFRNKRVNYELILVNNGSTDRTLTILKKETKKNRHLKLLNYKKNINPGRAIIEGMKKATGKYVGYTAGDGEISANDIHKVYEVLVVKKHDICKTIRLKRKDGFLRILLSKIFNLLVFILFGLKLTDINGYPLIMKREVWKETTPKIRNWMINLDVLYKCKQKNFKIGEVEIAHRERVGEKSKFYNASNPFEMFKLFTMFKDLIIYRLYGR